MMDFRGMFKQRVNKNIKNRIINYKINESEDEYYLLTNLSYSIYELKELYWKRWQVEIHFKESKYNLSLNKINLKLETL
jgi:IS4 transposase